MPEEKTEKVPLINNILDRDAAQLASLIASWGMPAFHARQIFTWIYQRGVMDFGAMSDLPAGLRQRLNKEFCAGAVRLEETRMSADGTEKFLLRLADGGMIETVSIPASGRVTGCISSQVGCKFACRFCVSGTFGFRRNLSAGEMIEEALYLRHRSAAKSLTHAVFMGSGEPLDNYDNVLRAVRMLNAKDGLNIGARRITISTNGLIPQIRRLAGEGLQIELSVSLHAADDRTRSLLMPVNKRYPLKDLVPACREYRQKTGRQVTFEYVLIRGINSSLADARKLGKILRGFDCKVNLIPLNAQTDPGLVPPERSETAAFRQEVAKSGVPVTIRQQRGEDIEAACGQLRSSYERRVHAGR
ncbi:MAG TPA: 23S rRNA (adenine(2503)-C(2))-methyltransferase RlmN, partial [Candidatus Omnitrophota bacterium]|nr:23S rRNA (adenine(2503)-C(2))-methyltransferase RlmN [Candidatus Omnitrophota bacterium]